MAIVNITSNEFLKETTAFHKKQISFLNIPIYSYTETTTNNKIVNSLTIQKKQVKTLGFNYETKD